MARWVRIAGTRECPPGHAMECLVESAVVALFNVDGRYYALDGICPHQGGPLAKGRVAGCTVSCPWHGWQFDVATGEHAANRRLRQRSFAVRVEGEEVLIEMEDTR
ncbi:MAG: ferredoxin [Planctomycetia bacterium 21-64-5]|nr:MAG: ferredoxin [Planctomycetia bacterium 21-64-5]HQU44480.1 Rieske 2Fe-2S domain-containing protein [Pirellulales bacterium]